MTTDALAVLLWDGYTAADCWRDMGPQGGSTLDAEKLAAWLRARGVVVLPADHPLRTGEPSEAMLDAAWNVLGPQCDESLRISLSLSAALRAALAVLRES